MNIREIATARLKEYENNPRNNDLAVEKVKYSIERFGFLVPVVVDINYVIVAGHTRVRACRELGLSSVPCIIADELTEEQINFFRLVDNKTSEYSDWDFEKLKNELSLIDLTLEENQLLLERFELSAEVFDIDPEQAEIKVTAFNFIGVNDKPKEKKPTVSTIQSSDIDTPEMSDESEGDKAYEDMPSPSCQTQVSVPETATGIQPTEAAMEISVRAANDIKHKNTPASDFEQDTGSTTAEPESKRSTSAPPFCQFRFGDVAFFISQIEQDRLNEKYAEYIDSGEMLKSSFAEYLLKGVEKHD